MLSVCLAGCELASDQPTELDDLGSTSRAVTAEAAIPSWVLNPVDFPPEKMGVLDCAYPFGCGSPDPTLHPEAGCWEKEPTEDGWVRQQIHQVHCGQLATCNGGPGDANLIRVCRGANEVSPCEGKVTGQNGCAICVTDPVCH